MLTILRVPFHPSCKYSCTGSNAEGLLAFEDKSIPTLHRSVAKDYRHTASSRFKY